MAARPDLVDGSYIQGCHKEKFKHPEVLFPGRFTNQQPWETNPGFIENPQEATVPIYRLSHITHNQEARQIHPDGADCYTFKPKAKVGKAYEWDGSPRGETYQGVYDDVQETYTYQKIPRSEDNPVFPGSLSWWGVDVREWYETNEGKDLSDEVDRNYHNRQYAPGYLAAQTGSQYGNNAFSMKLEDILTDYKRSRHDQHGREVCLKVGGTLRYRNEICYVLIVCMEGDDMTDMPNVTDASAPFNTNGIVKDGKVVDYTAIPEIKVDTIVKYDCTSYSWEQLAFGFYFPNDDQEFRCTNVQQSGVKHNPPWCTSTQPLVKNSREKWVCPNEKYP